MNPIINPWWIYFAEKSGTLGMAFIVIGVMICIVYGLINFFSFMDGYEPIKSKYILVISIIMIFIGSLLPNQKTVLTMMTLQQLTPNNIEIAENTIETTVDYIIEKVEDIIEEDD